MASHTRSVFSASRMVLPMRISEAMAAEWVIPEQPMVSTSASSMMPFLMFRVSLQAPLLRGAPADTVGKAGDIGDFLGLHPPPLLRDGSRAVVSALGHRTHMLYFRSIDHGNDSFLC